MTDRRQRTYTFRLGNTSIDVVGLDGICELLPPAAATELRARQGSFNAAVSAGGGTATVRLAALNGMEFTVTRHAPAPASYNIHVWRGRIVNARTIDPEHRDGLPDAVFTGPSYTAPEVEQVGADVLQLILAKLPSIRSRLSTDGNAYIQTDLGNGRGVGIRITRKD